MTTVLVVAAIALAATIAIAALVFFLLDHVRRSTAQAQAAAVETVLALASDKLGAHLQAGTQHTDLRNDAITRELAGLGNELARVTSLVATLQKERAEQHGQLVAGLAQHARTSADLAATAQSLRAALSSPKARGQWGERMADDVLRLAGLVEGVSYRKQTATAAGTIPDVTFLLPGGRLLHMDVKFPIDNYLRVLDATNEAEERASTAAFLRDVRNRIKELSGRGYIEAGVTLDYVLAFIPNEAVYGFVHEHDPGLVDVALRQRVVLCSPFTLFAVLAVIRQAVEQSALERRSDEILTALSGFSQQWERFGDALDGLGRRLESTQRAYEDLAGPRRRQLQRTLDRVDVLAEGPVHGPTVELRPDDGGALRVVG